MQKTIFQSGILIFWIIFPGILPGSGTRVDFVDAFAVGRGNAFSATADNPSAVYYNPAGITQLEGFQVRGGSYFIALDYSVEIDGRDIEMDDSLQALPNLFVTSRWKKESPVWLGLGVYVPFGLATDWPDDSPFFAVADRADLRYITVNPVIAWKLSERFSIGAGPTVNQAKLEFSQNLIGFHFDGTDTSPGYVLSALWKATERHHFALLHRSFSDSNFTGSVELPVAPGTVLSSPAGASFPFPDIWRAGYSFRPNPRWNLEVNLEWMDWDVLNTVVLENDINPVPFVFDWNSSWFYEFGVTRYLNGGYHVSAGYDWVENSIPDATFTPVVPDSDRHFFSVGAGYQGERWSWDVALQYGTGSRTLPSNPAAPPGFQFGGKHETDTYAFNLTFAYHY